MTDEEIMAELEPWKKIVDEQGTRLVGVSNVYLKKSDCNLGECNIGSLITDAYVHAVGGIVTIYTKKNGLITHSLSLPYTVGG